MKTTLKKMFAKKTGNKQLVLLFFCILFSVHAAHFPKQLVEPSANHETIQLVDEPKLLSVLPPEQKYVTIGIVGLYHSGKSFLLNALYHAWCGFFDSATENNCDTGAKLFDVASKVQPKTMGIWALDTGIYVQDDIRLLFIDTEGFAGNDVSESYDARIFTATTMLSSYLLYNSIKLIDQSAVEYLEILARRTQLFQLHNALHVQQEETLQTESFLNVSQINFPPLTWVVEDFFQDLDGMSPQQWLEQYLKGKRDHAAKTRDASLHDVFKKGIDCHTLFLPSAQLKELENLGAVQDLRTLNEQFISDLQQLRVKILDKLQHAQVKTGEEIVLMLKYVLQNINNIDAYPNVPSIWNQWVDQLMKQAQGDVEQYYQEQMHSFALSNQKPKNFSLLQQKHDEVYTICLQFYKSMLFELPSLYEEGLTNLNSSLLHLHSEKKNELRKIIVRYIEDETQKMLTDALIEQQHLISIPMDPEVVAQKKEKAEKNWPLLHIQTFSSEYGVEEAGDVCRKQHDLLARELQKSYLDVAEKNVRVIDEILHEAREQCFAAYKKNTLFLSNKMRTRMEMEAAHKLALEQCLFASKESIEKKISKNNWLSKTSAFGDHVRAQKEGVERIFGAITAKNVEMVRAHTEKICASQQEKIHAHHAAFDPFPDHEEELVKKAADLHKAAQEHIELQTEPYKDFVVVEEVVSAAHAAIHQMLVDTLARNVKAVKSYSFYALQCAEKQLQKQRCVFCARNLIPYFFRHFALEVGQKCFTRDEQGMRFSKSLRDKALWDWIGTDISGQVANVQMHCAILCIFVVIFISICVCCFRFARKKSRPRKHSDDEDSEEEYFVQQQSPSHTLRKRRGFARFTTSS